jgi:hypothetical protein
VAAYTTPDEWLPVLSWRLDLRYPTITRIRDYANGRAPLPEMGKNLRASWIAFQKKARTDYGGLAVGSLANRLRVNGIQIGGTDDNEAVLAARRIWRDNRLDVQVADAILDYLETGFGYLVVGLDVDGSAIITREFPEQFIAATDPLRPWRARAALKVWRDLDVEMDFARVWSNDMAQMYWRPARETVSQTLVRGAAAGGWEKYGDPELFDGPPPVSVLDRSEAFLTPHTDLIDRIILDKLQRLVTTASQAFKQRAIKGGLPEKDEDGNDIDWAAILEPAPGALWDLPEGIDIWESQQTDITPMLAGEISDAREYAAVTRTPVSVLIPDGANQSAEGAASSKEGQIFQARDEIARLSPSLEIALVYALRAEGVDLADDTVEVLWTPPEHVSLSEKFAAAAQAKAAGIPLRQVMRDVLGMSPQQIQQVEQDVAAEQLSAMLLTQPAPATNAAPIAV